METNERGPTGQLDAYVVEIVTSYLRINQVAPTDLPTLISTVHQALQSLGKPPEPDPVLTAAVTIRQSVHRDYVVCLDCGWRGATLRRHLASRHDLSPDAYRARWSLSADHPLTAPAYSQRRAEFAKQIGLGNRRIEVEGDGEAASAQAEG